jgi:hypothetical protein
VGREDELERPDPDLPQDPGIPGFDVVSEEPDASAPVRNDDAAVERERLDEPDREGHMTAPSGDEEADSRAG